MANRLCVVCLSIVSVLLLGGTAPAQVGEPPAGTQPKTMAPRLLKAVSPEFTPEALEAGITGVVVVALVVKADASVEILNIPRGLGYGLDEKAIECVQKWEFQPGTRDGTPVDVRAHVEINFKLP